MLETSRKYTERVSELDQDYQNTNDPKVYQQIKVLKTKRNDILLDEVEKRNKFLKQSYYETGSRATKLLPKCTCKQQVININQSICIKSETLT